MKDARSVPQIHWRLPPWVAASSVLALWRAGGVLVNTDGAPPDRGRRAAVRGGRMSEFYRHPCEREVGGRLRRCAHFARIRPPMHVLEHELCTHEDVIARQPLCPNLPPLDGMFYKVAHATVCRGNLWSARK